MGLKKKKVHDFHTHLKTDSEQLTRKVFNTEIFHHQPPKPKDSSRYHLERCSCLQAKPIHAQVNSSLQSAKDLLDLLCCLVESFLTQCQGILLTILLKSFYYITTFQEDVNCNREINRANLFCIIKVLKWWRCEIPISLFFYLFIIVQRIIEANWSLLHFSTIDVDFSWNGMKHCLWREITFTN